MKTEDEIRTEIRKHFGLCKDLKLFANPIGVGWLGELASESAGRVTLKSPRRQAFGLCPGSADFIGWYRGRFFSPEVKSATGKPTDIQLIFLTNVIAGGGIAGVVRSVDDVNRLLLISTEVMFGLVIEEVAHCTFTDEKRKKAGRPAFNEELVSIYYRE